MALPINSSSGSRFHKTSRSQLHCRHSTTTDNKTPAFLVLAEEAILNAMAALVVAVAALVAASVADTVAASAVDTISDMVADKVADMVADTGRMCGQHRQSGTKPVMSNSAWRLR